jgi:hypothetical protein
MTSTIDSQNDLCHLPQSQMILLIRLPCNSLVTVGLPCNFLYKLNNNKKNLKNNNKSKYCALLIIVNFVCSICSAYEAEIKVSRILQADV